MVSVNVSATATVNPASFASSDTRRTCLHCVSDLVSDHAEYAQRPEVPAVARANTMVPPPSPKPPKLNRPCKVRALCYLYRYSLLVSNRWTYQTGQPYLNLA